MFIGLDLGTTNIKAVAVSADGRICARGAAPVELLYLDEGGVEQEIEEIWQAALAALCSLGESVNLSEARALGVSAQGGALQRLDEQGRPVGRVISWLDTRGRTYDDEFTQTAGADWLIRHTGHGHAATSIGQILRLRREDAESLDPPNAIGYVGDVIVARLCGRRAHDATSLSLAMLFNPSLGGPDPELLDLLQVAPSQLPELVPADTPAGELRPEVAGETGLPAGIPVSAALHDQYAATLGAGAVHAGDIMFGAGTAWVLLAVADRFPRAVTPGAFVCTHPAPGRYGLLLSLANGGSAFDWALRIMGLKGRSVGELDALMAAVPAGSAGLRCYPFLVSGGGLGLQHGQPAGLVGLSLAHGQGHVLRAVTEGLAFELSRYLRAIEQNGLPLGRLIMCGGATASSVTPQIVADAAGMPVATLAETGISALGAAMIARALAEPNAELTRIVSEMTPELCDLRPGPDADIYHKLLDEYLARVSK